MSDLSSILVDCFELGTLPGDIFMELQTVFQNYHGDNGATRENEISHNALRVLFDRGFVEVYRYGHSPRSSGYVPTERAQARLFLQLAHGGRQMEPRDAFDARLVVNRPEWAAPLSGLGLAV